MKNNKKLDYHQIRVLQKELQNIGVAEEIVDYKISREYLNLFLKMYSKLDGDYGYIQGAILTSLFDFIRSKYPNISESGLIIKSQKLYPIIRIMLIHEKVFKLISDAKKGKLKKLQIDIRK